MAQNTSSSTMTRTTSSAMTTGVMDLTSEKKASGRSVCDMSLRNRYTESGRSAATEFAYFQARLGAVAGGGGQTPAQHWRGMGPEKQPAAFVVPPEREVRVRP